MTLSITCEQCGQVHALDDGQVGRTISCQGCGNTLQVSTDATTTELSASIQERLLNSQVYESTATLDQVLCEIQALRGFDKEHEELEAKGTKFLMFGGLCVLGVPGFMVLSIAASGSSLVPVLLGLAAVSGLAAGGLLIYGGILKFKHGKLNLENRRYEVAARLLSLLKADTHANGEVRCKIDFRPHNHKSHFARNGKAGYWNVEYFASRWFELDGRLADGTKYAVGMMVKHQDRSRTKTSASGKLKTKTKTKSAQEGFARLRFKPERYPISQEIMNEALDAIRLPEGVAVKKFDVGNDSLLLTVTTPRGFSGKHLDEARVTQETVQLLTAMLLSLYQILNLSKAIDKASN